jgi:hypothetical protein
MRGVLLAMLLFTGAAHAGSGHLPTPEVVRRKLSRFDREAVTTILTVYRAAMRNDLDTIRSTMDAPFYAGALSFDQNPDRAIEDWRAHPDKLRRLAAAIAGGCRAIDTERTALSCPTKDRYGIDVADFERRDGRWRFRGFAFRSGA